MNTVSNNTEMNAILKEFARGNHKNSYLKIKEYLKRFPNDLVARYNSGVIAENKEDPIKERQANTKINFLLIFILLF